MTDIQKPDMSKQWANSGNKTPPADSLINSGWNSGDIPTNADFNFIDARQDQGVAYILQKGIAEWDNSTEYCAGKSFVQYNEVIYKCLQSNTNQPPSLTSAYWKVVFGNVWVDVSLFGAKGTGTDDDFPAVQSAVNYLESIGGGTLLFGNGTYKLGQQLTISSKSIKFVGTGKRGVYPGIFSPTKNTVATLLPVHTGRCAIRFYSTTVNAINSFVFESMAMATLETGNYPVAAFGWDCTGPGAFQRDFTFNNSSIHGFTSAFDVYGSGPNNQQGLLKVENCNINRNTWIARTLDGTQWNGFSFTKNEAGQNGYAINQGGINVQAHSVVITQNCMEGMRDPVKIYGAMRGVAVWGNYFEAIVGRAGVELDSVRGTFLVGPNTYLAVDNSVLANKALGTNVGIGTWNDPVWLNGAHKNTVSPLGADFISAENVLNPEINTDDYGLMRVDVPTMSFTNLPAYTAKISNKVTTGIVRGVSPLDGAVIPVAEYTTSGSGVVAMDFSVTGTPGEYAVFSAMMKLIPDGGSVVTPYVSMLVNNASGNGSRDYPIYNFTSYWVIGDWVQITCAVKLTGNMTSLRVNLFPYGVNPSAGRVVHYGAPVVYVTTTPTSVQPYIDNFALRAQSTAPSTGTWQVGDRLLNSNPSAGGQSEFLYTSAGWVYG